MAANDAADDQLDLKKRARRRLVGAAALALLAVIVFPMVMDREPKPSSQDIQVVIPSQDAPKLAAKAAPVKAPVVEETSSAPMPAPTVAAATAPKAANVASKPEAQPELKSEAKPDGKVAAAKPVDKAADKPAKDKAEKPAEKLAEKAAAKKADEARAAAALEGKSSSGQSGQWVVQIGAYQNAGNVKLIVGKMKEMGIPSFTEKLDTPQGPRIRVRAGPFPSRDAAEKAQAKMKIIGVGGPVAPK